GPRARCAARSGRPRRLRRWPAGFPAPAATAGRRRARWPRRRPRPATAPPPAPPAPRPAGLPAAGAGAASAGRSRQRFQAEALAALGDDAGGADLAADPPDQHVQGVGIGVVTLFVDVLAQFGAADHRTLAVHQVGEDALL